MSRYVISASQVGPQQKAWILNFMHDTSENGVSGTYLARLPVELREEIVAFLPGLMTQAEANKIREELMQERRQYVDDYNQEVMAFPFNMCEH